MPIDNSSSKFGVPLNTASQPHQFFVGEHNLPARPSLLTAKQNATDITPTVGESVSYPRLWPLQEHCRTDKGDERGRGWLRALRCSSRLDY